MNGVTVYDDFAHHPTAIETTIEGLRASGRRRQDRRRARAALEHDEARRHEGVAGREPRRGSDLVFCYSAGLAWDARAVLAPLGAKAVVDDDFDRLADAVAAASRPGDHVLVMSNGGFGGMHEKLLTLLAGDG